MGRPREPSSFRVDHPETSEHTREGEPPDSWWFRIYAAVIAVTVLVIAALWAFTRFFS